MLREILPVAALALALGAAPASAQPAPAPASAPSDDSTAARTLEQNRRVLFWHPASFEVPRGTVARPAAPMARVDEARAAPAGRAGRRS